MHLRCALVPVVALLVGCGCAGPTPGSTAAATTDAGLDTEGGEALDANDGSIVDAAAPAPEVDAPPGANDPSDGGPDGAADVDAGIACAWGGAPGTCISVTACAGLADHTPYAGECPGPAAIECCIRTPSTADNPPAPAGYKLMTQAEVTAERTTWAVAILNDPVTYPMFTTATKTFGTLLVLARVEWHPPDFQNGVVHRGVTLYEPL